MKDDIDLNLWDEQLSVLPYQCHYIFHSMSGQTKGIYLRWDNWPGHWEAWLYMSKVEDERDLFSPENETCPIPLQRVFGEEEYESLKKAAYDWVMLQDKYERDDYFHPNFPAVSSTTSGDAQRQRAAAYVSAPRVIVAGGRDFSDYSYFAQTLDKILFTDDDLFGPETKIISGMAEGADRLAIRYADERGLAKVLFPANWKRHYRSAGFLRNADMMSFATHLIAFWNRQSSGTRHIIELAREKGIPMWVMPYK